MTRSYKESLEAYSMLLDISSADAEALLNCSYIHYQLDDYQKMVEDLNAAETLVSARVAAATATYEPPLLVLISNNKGVAWYKQRKYDMALSCFQVALSIQSRPEIEQNLLVAQMEPQLCSS
eukprot:TRINITY_DN20524_c0_g1_i1.p1 TRINITY_DN20524_c0_g1~~TRINITY_DN20524_c0_g1_i1.p1  ORF type:complete len:122 (-),score=25.47 TRINITY_DN20524_c0_g1_i1:48-413(-)